MRQMTYTGFVGLLVAGLYLTAGCGPRQVSYSKDIRPLLETSCMDCHRPGGEGFAASALSMESYDTLMKGTQFGPVIKPGDSASSTLVRLVSGQADPSIRMPHDNRKPLTEKQIASIRAWIDQGAKNN